MVVRDVRQSCRIFHAELVSGNDRRYQGLSAPDSGEPKKKLEGLRLIADLADFGVSPAEAEVLLEDGFPFKEYLKKRRVYERKSRVYAMVEMAEAVRAGTLAAKSLQGARMYDAWRHQTLQSLNEKLEQDLTVFEKIKKARSGMTLFDRLKKKRKKEST